MIDVSQDERSTVGLLDALKSAMRAANKVRKEFLSSLPPCSVAHDLEWVLRYGSEDRLIFVFSVIIDLEESFDLQAYPREEVNGVTADLRERLIGTEVDAWGVWVVTVTARPRLVL